MEVMESRTDIFLGFDDQETVSFRGDGIALDGDRIADDHVQLFPIFPCDRFLRTTGENYQMILNKRLQKHAFSNNLNVHRRYSGKT